MFGLYDDREYVLTEGGQFYPGLSNHIIEAIQNLWPHKNIHLAPVVDLTLNRCLYDGEFEDDILPGITPFDYQREAAMEAMKNIRCIVKLPTASGKSAVISYIIAHVLKYRSFINQIVILVPTNNLVIQFFEDMINVYGMSDKDIGTWTSGSKTWTPDKRVLITTRDSLYNNKMLIKNTSKKISVLFNDECHLSGSDMLVTTQRRLKPFSVIGMTGSLPQDDFKLHRVIGCNGSVVYSKDTVNLQKDGYLPFCDTYLVRFNIPFEKFVDHHDESRFIYESNFWAKTILKIVEAEKKNGRNTLVLVNYTNAGNLLSEKTGMRFLSGSNSNSKQKQDIKAKMEQEDGVNVIATYGIFSTGVSIKNLHTVVLAEPAQGFTTLVQSIGRSIRRHESKKDKKVRVLDLYTDLKYSYRWATKKRLPYYKKENFDIKKIDESELWKILDR